MILVDSSVWIDFFNGADSIERQKLRELIVGNNPVGITDLIITEILQGIRNDDQFEKVKKHCCNYLYSTLNQSKLTFMPLRYIFNVEKKALQ